MVEAEDHSASVLEVGAANRLFHGQALVRMVFQKAGVKSVYLYPLSFSPMKRVSPIGIRRLSVSGLYMIAKEYKFSDGMNRY